MECSRLPSRCFVTGKPSGSAALRGTTADLAFSRCFARGNGGRVASRPERRSAVVRNGRRNSQVCGATYDRSGDYQDSFGNECMLEKRAHLELMANEMYGRVVNSLADMKQELDKLVAVERYEEAAQIRDSMTLLEFRKRLLEMSAKPRVLFRVGDTVYHKKNGYKGVIFGHDPECSAPPDWQKTEDVASLVDGSNQPFYHILVDVRDNPKAVTSYVAQEDLQLRKSCQPVLHPWISRFFVGFQDGTFFPGSKLRQMYPNDW